MSMTAYVVGGLVVVLSTKPALNKSRKVIRDARNGIADLIRRKFVLSQKLRSLARESLGQRLTTGADTHESTELNEKVAELQARVRELEAVDRRVLVLDERRGLSESGWIILIRRTADHAHPLEPMAITRLWDEGRLLFFYASDVARARRKAAVRFQAEQGFQILEVFAHEGDMSEAPVIGGGKRIGA